MNLLNIENLSKAYGLKLLFDNISLGINEGDKIGIIGRNGEGKTSLLKILAGQEKPDKGSIAVGNSVDIEYLPQNVDFKEDLTVIEQVFRSDSENISLVRQYEEAINQEDLDHEKILSLSQKMDRANAWELESEAKAILGKLGIADYSKKVGQLSGGQKRRLALAAALINPSDLLILDEPTNHLDNKTVEWLEEYLRARKGGLLMVTHDRYFLNRVTNKIVELDQGQLYEYDGNYEYFVEKKTEREEMDQASERKRRSIYRKELAWMRQGVKARGTRSRSRVDRFQELKESSLKLNDQELNISVAGQRLGKKIIELENISKSFSDKVIIKNFFYTLVKDDRIGILGDNGAGKTSLMDILAGVEEPSLGEISFGETLKIGYFSQESKGMDLDLRAIDYIRETADYVENEEGHKISASQMMESFLFNKEEQYTPIKNLSGGERRRLYLLKILMEGPNMLVLDEPTNDLDINTLNVLEDYIINFRGPVVVVSHDRYFLDKIVDKVFHIEDGEVREYPGNYSYFKEIMDQLEMEEEASERRKKEDKKKEKKDTSYRKNPSLKFSYNDQRDWDNIGLEIEALEEDLSRLDQEMEAHQTDYKKLEELLEERAKKEEELDLKMARWLELSELKEKIDSQK